ncbi:hypothetical protein [Pseudofrankia asymbiotica]|uniref:YtxH domain-containing protein n=1 Tax=Pseudofrankia asymbiotica TaxID=1834516 RepID=A0A1V2HZU8_9ACTN|nr:hypothetical protein [Pseudofrankia asymbiotica]ONH22471.1 hypothetical protein BL253_35620 [Pseudofrankia asymbiotica]
MRIRPSVALAFGVGYLFGTRAGRESYEDLTRQARLVWDRPEVQSVAGIVSAQVGGVYRRARTLLGGSEPAPGPSSSADRFAPASGTPASGTPASNGLPSNGLGASTTP